jgi:hypothetical protein
MNRSPWSVWNSTAQAAFGALARLALQQGETWVDSTVIDRCRRWDVKP